MYVPLSTRLSIFCINFFLLVYLSRMCDKSVILLLNLYSWYRHNEVRSYSIVLCSRTKLNPNQSRFFCFIFSQYESIWFGSKLLNQAKNGSLMCNGGILPSPYNIFKLMNRLFWFLLSLPLQPFCCAIPTNNFLVISCHICMCVWFTFLFIIDRKIDNGWYLRRLCWDTPVGCLWAMWTSWGLLHLHY